VDDVELPGLGRWDRFYPLDGKLRRELMKQGPNSLLRGKEAHRGIGEEAPEWEWSLMIREAAVPRNVQIGRCRATDGAVV
jgi:hypothetical protein